MSILSWSNVIKLFDLPDHGKKNSRARVDYDVDKSEDVFAFKVSDNCLQYDQEWNVGNQLMIKLISLN